MSNLICLAHSLPLIVILLRGNRLVLLNFRGVVANGISWFNVKAGLLLVLQRKVSLFFQVFFMLF